MASESTTGPDQKLLTTAMTSFIQIAVLMLIVFWCFQILRPFINVVVWGIIISIAVYPGHVAMTKRFGGKAGLSKAIILIIGLSVILLPAWLLTESTIEGVQHVNTYIEEGSATIPPPNEAVADWPLIGERIYGLWSSAATNLEDTLNKHADQLQSVGATAISVAGSTIATVFQFMFATIIAVVLLGSSESGYRATKNIAAKLLGREDGDRLTDLTILTIRSVVKGVLGVAVIQAILAAIGLVIVDVPAAGVWAGIVLVLAVVQLPPWFVMLPVAVWYYSVAEPVPATIFLVYALIVSFSDAVLKPMLLGRGLETPMLVILLGAIGGMLAFGLIGLFIGAVVMALGYELLVAWMTPDEDTDARIAGAS